MLAVTNEQEEALGALPPRQLQILQLVATHLSTKEIAQQLGLSPYTVDAHIVALRRRLGGLTRVEAGRLLATWEASKPLADDQGPTSFGMASRRAAKDTSRTRPHRYDMAMMAVAARAILDAIYVSLFFLVMSAVAYGSHRLVQAAKTQQVDGIVVSILHLVEIILVAVDGIGVVSASVILTYRFVTTLIHAGGRQQRRDR